MTGPQRDDHLHADPLVEQAMRSIHRSAGEEPYAIDEASLARLEASLKEQFDSPGLASTVFELCAFACWLAKEERSPAACDALLAVAKSALEPLRRLADEKAQAAEQLINAAESGKLTGQGGLAKHKTSATEAPPEGSVRSDPFARFKLRDPSDEKK
jgi:hypothetical protein